VPAVALFSCHCERKTSTLTRSPLGSLVDKGAQALDLYKYGRKPFIFFTLAIALSMLAINGMQTAPFVKGLNPPNPEWKESFVQLLARVQHLYRSLIFAGSFVLGVSQAVKKSDLLNPDLTYVYLYGKLILTLLVVEFVCNLLLQPTKGSDGLSQNFFILWLRSIARDTSEQMISGVSSGFGYGYLVKGAGILFKAY
jgi:hypothetical protein